MYNNGRSKRSTSQTQYNRSTTTASDRKEPERNDTTLQSLWTLLRETHPLVWCNFKSGRRVRREVARLADGGVLIKKLGVNDGFMLLDSVHVDSTIPENISAAEVAVFIRSIDRLVVANFQVIAPIRYDQVGIIYTKTVHENIVVDRYARMAKQLHVAKAGTSKWYPVAVNDLRVGQAVDSAAERHAEELSRIQYDLERSEKMNETLNKQLKEAQTDLLNRQEQSELSQRRLEQELRNRETQLATERSTVDEMKRSVRDSKNSLSQKNNLITRLKSEIAQLKKSETNARAKIQECNAKIRQNKIEIQNIQRELEQQLRTVENFEKKASADQTKIQRLEQDCDQAYRQIAEHRDELRVFQQETQELRNARAKIEKLTEDYNHLNRQLQDTRGGALVQEYRGYDFGKEMAELRDQKLEDAAGTLSTCLDLDEEGASKMMFKIFMFVYRFCQDRLAGLFEALNVSGNEKLERMYIIRFQDTYQETSHVAALESAFSEAFSPELGDAALDNFVLEYVRKSGEICWCVVIHLDPRLHFLPTEQVESQIMFDSSQFKDITSSIRKGDAAEVMAYVLPGLYRVDANLPVSPDARPCVFPKKIRKVAKVTKVEPSVAVRESSPARPRTENAAPDMSQEELMRALEEDIWNGNLDDAKEKMRRLHLSTWRVEICCGEDGCGAVLFKQWQDYERLTAMDGACQCPANEDHENVVIRKKW